MSLPHDPGLLHNDLERPARSLCHAIGEALRDAREAGAEPALVSGSGPTVVGLFARANGLAAAERAAAGLAGCEPPPLTAATVGADFGRPAGLPIRHN
jgi:4-diphosphocytidyl-2-C-methyl-D-erythritol kinase